MKIPKPRRLVKRNPIAAEMARNPLYRTRSEPSAAATAQKDDPWNRAAKHKTMINDDDGDFDFADDYE